MAIELCTTPVHYSVSRSWGIVLAGGEGRRLKHFIKSEFGKECPKQFCAIIGRRSMFRHTIDRAELLIPDERLLTVVNREHLAYAVEDIQYRAKDTVFIIPSNRETAPSILLPLLSIHKKDPDATVAIFPSDHFILEEDIFMDYVSAALEFVKVMKEYIVTLAVTPFNAQSGYGWIMKGDVLHHSGRLRFYTAKHFWEKPDYNEAMKIFKEGCLVNTMIMVGKVQLFINLFREHTPALFNQGLRIKHALGSRDETEVIEEAFNSVPPINFSQTILQNISHQLCVLPMSNIYWSDWGEEDRIRTDLERLRRYKKNAAIHTQYLKESEAHSIEFYTH